MSKRNTNIVILTGNLGNDPDVKHTNGGKQVAHFNLAVSNGEHTEWAKIICWEKLADISSKYLSKGSQVLVRGRLATRSWEDQQGQKRYSTEVIAEAIEFLDSRKVSETDAIAF